MKRPKIKKIVRKKIKSGKRLVKRSKNDTSNKDYAEMLFQVDEKTLDSETLIKVAQKRVSDSIINGIEYSPFKDDSEGFLRDHVNSRVHIFVMYIDMVNSTNITLSLSEEKIVKLITSFAQEMAYTVTQFGGYMLKFVGDAVIGYFIHTSVLIAADNAVSCAQRMIQIMEQGVNPILNNYDYPDLLLHIGLDYGDNMIVRYGSDKEKSHVDILGPTMNIAAKIQSMAKPQQILIGQDVYEKIHPTVQQKFKKEEWSQTKWKYNHRKTGKPYIVYSLDG